MPKNLIMNELYISVLKYFLPFNYVFLEAKLNLSKSAKINASLLTNVRTPLHRIQKGGTANCFTLGMTPT